MKLPRRQFVHLAIVGRPFSLFPLKNGESSKMEKRASRKDGRGARLGERRGGRRKGTPNKRTAALRKAIETFAIAGEQPLEVMLSVMRNPDLPPMLRFDAACKAAPYVHPKLAAVQHGGKVDLGLGARLDAAVKRLAEQEARANGKDRALGHPPP